MLKILFGDSSNFTGTSQNVKNISLNKEIFLDTRVFPVAPVSDLVSSDWNGEKIDVQLVKWFQYRIELACKESQMLELSNLKYCRSMSVFETDGTVYIGDLSDRNFINVEISEINDTAVFLVKILFRANKTIIDYQKDIVVGSPVSFTFASSKTVDAEFTALSNTYTIESNLPVILSQGKGQMDSDEQTGLRFINRTLTKKAILARFYLSNSDYNLLLKYINKCDTCSLIDENSISYTILAEKNITENKQVGIDLFQVDLELIYEVSSFYNSV